MKQAQLFRSIILSMALVLCSQIAYSQSTPVAKDSVVVINPVAVSDIPAEIEILKTRIKEIEKSIQPSEQIKDQDSVFNVTKSYLIDVKEKLDDIDLNDLNLRATENYKREWIGYKDILVSIRTKFNDRSQQLQGFFEELNDKEKIWNKTLDAAREEKVASELISSSSDVLTSINNLKKATKKQQDHVLKVYKSINDEVSNVDEVIEMLNERLKELHSLIFVQDSPPLWSSIDSTSSPGFVKRQIIKTIEDNTRRIDVYLSANTKTLYYQIGFILLLVVLFLYLKQKTRFSNINEQNINEVRAAIVLQRPVASALVLGILISLFFYTNRPLPITELFMIIYMIPVMVLSKKFIEKKFIKLLYIIIGLFILNTLESYVYIYAFANRIILISFAAITLFILLFLYKQKAGFLKKPKGRIAKIINLILFVYILLIVLSIFGFIFGSVDFSFLLLNSVIRSVVFSVVSVTIITILLSLLIILTKESKGQHYFSISKYQKQLVGRLKPVIEFSGIVFWAYATLSSFGVYDNILEWIGAIMDVSWTYSDGRVSISLGGIISFLIVLIISFLLAKAVKVIFADDWVYRSKIPRGVPQAISMTLRYIIIGFGIYLALTAAGVELNKFGLIAGTLGVGIGFGLQGVVYNFIAGLILSYERPIHVGDTIQLNTLMGVVTEIGVRASNVRTYDGSEVIVPNSELISKQVINWTLSNEQRRLKIEVRTSLNADPRVVMKLLREIATSHPNTLTNPEPMILFDGYGNSSLDFTVYMWINFNVSFSTRSEVALQIYDAIKEAGYDVPIPLQRIQYSSDENAEDDDFPPIEKGH